MADLTITSVLSDYYTNLKYTDLTKDTLTEVKRSILDSLGCMISGSQTGVIKELKTHLMKDEEIKRGNVFGYDEKASIFTALLLNGSMAHAVEMDDVHKEAKAHAGAVVVPSALTMAQVLNSSGKDFLLSVLTGYEVMLRIGRGLNASEHRLQGWHATGTCGTFGAAAAIASLHQFDEQQFTDTLGLAGTQSSGLWAFTANGANSKMFHTGSAALSGYIANQLTLGGMTGSNQILEAKDGGLFKASSKNYSYHKVTDLLNEEFLIDNITRKPFACCRSMHPSIEVALELREEIDDLNEITKIDIYTYEVAKVQCGYTNRPENVADAKFSLPFGVAVALTDGAALLNQFSASRINDEELLSLSEKVAIHVDEKIDNEYPQNWGSRVEIETTSAHFVKQVENAKGDPANPLSQKELEDKFIYLTESILGLDHSLELIEIVNNIEQYDDLSELYKLCCTKNKEAHYEQR